MGGRHSLRQRFGHAPPPAERAHCFGARRVTYSPFPAAEFPLPLWAVEGPGREAATALWRKSGRHRRLRRDARKVDFSIFFGTASASFLAS